MEGNISRDLKKWRKKAKLSQVQLADKVKVNRKTVSDWENAKKPEKWPKHINCLKLSDILQIKVTTEGIIENHINNMKANNTEESSQQNSDGEWYKKTIETLIHQNGNTVEKLTETVDKLHDRDQAEIEDLKNEKSLLWQDKTKSWEHIDTLTAHLQPPQHG